MSNSIIQNTVTVFRRELRHMVSRPIYLFSSVFVMIFCYIFFLTFFSEGLPEQLPVGLVDQDDSYVSRTLARNLNASAQVEIMQQYTSFDEARKDMQRGKIYAIVVLPANFEKDLLAQRQPQLTYYVNDAYLVAGSLSYKDLTFISELGTAYIQQQLLKTKGVVGDENLMPLLQPIVIDTHLIGNPYANYGIYLLNVLLPGVLQLLIIMLTVFSIGIELKERTAIDWYLSANNSILAALTGKMLPYTVLFTVLGIGGNLVLYEYMHFPMNGSLAWMCLATFLYVIAYQAIGIFIIGVFPRMRDAISLSAFYGLLAFTYAGFTFPIEAMPRGAKIFADLFPIRPYFKIYVNEALNGADIRYSLVYYAAMMAFLILPLLVYLRLTKVIEQQVCEQTKTIDPSK